MARSNYSNPDTHKPARSVSAMGTPLDVMFESVVFPADRASLLRFGRENDIDQTIQSQIERLNPNQSFKTMDDLQIALGAGSAWDDDESDEEDQEYENKPGAL